jgi:hypothetical protein
MTDRGQQLHATADAQVGGLIGLDLTLDETALRRPCPGREKLSDGTVGASARHTADNYHRIADHDGGYTADAIDVGAVVEQLSASRDTLGQIAELTDTQLDAIPPDGSFRFCDGHRTLEQVLASLLKHQAHPDPSAQNRTRLSTAHERLA